MQQVNVGIIDGGFFDHTDLPYTESESDRLLSNRNRIHGTHTSGTIASIWNDDGINGIIRSANLYRFVGVNTDNDSMNTIMDSLRQNNVKAVNVSLGLNPPNVDGIDEALRSGALSETDEFYRSLIEIRNLYSVYMDIADRTLFIQSAGNQSINAMYNGLFSTMWLSNNRAEYERYRNKIILVGALQHSTTNSVTTASVAPYSNYGNQIVEIFAPGSGIFSNANNNGIVSLDGTSMAAPHVTGVAGMLFAVDDTLTPEQIKKCIIGPFYSATRYVRHTVNNLMTQYPTLNAYQSLYMCTSPGETMSACVIYQDGHQIVDSDYHGSNCLNNTTWTCKAAWVTNAPGTRSYDGVFASFSQAESYIEQTSTQNQCIRNQTN